MDDFSQTAGSPLACSAKPVLYFLWEMCTTLPTPFSMLCTIADASPTPHGDGNRSRMASNCAPQRMHPLPLTGTETHQRCRGQPAYQRDASPTPHGDGNAIMIPPTLFPLGCIPYPSRGRKPATAVASSKSSKDASPTPHGDGNHVRLVHLDDAHRCIPYPSRGRKRFLVNLNVLTSCDASPTPHGDGND